MSRQSQRALTRHTGCLNEKHFPSRRRPCEPQSYTRVLGALSNLFILKPRCAQHLGDRIYHDVYRVRLALRMPSRHLTTQCTDLSLEITHTGFSGVTSNKRSQRVVFKCDLFRCQPMVQDLTLDKMFRSDLKLFLFGITR